MGNTFEVWCWGKDVDGQYAYTQFWRGQNFFSAIINLVKAKRTGAGCVKLEWR